MIYRPQFPYLPAPEGFEDEDFIYYFDAQNTVAFGIVLALPPGEDFRDIPLQLQRDGEFRWRGVQVSNPGGALALQFQTPDGTALSDDYVPAEVYSGLPGGVSGQPGGVPVPLEAEIVCAAGSVILVSVKNMV
jgi:hypothetical protein